MTNEDMPAFARPTDNTRDLLDRVSKLSAPSTGDRDGADLFQQLQQDRTALKQANLEILEEFKVVLFERDQLEATIKRERELHDIEAKTLRERERVAVAETIVLRERLATIRTHMTDSGALLLRAVKVVEDLADVNPEAVQAYRPAPSATRMPTNTLGQVDE